MHELFQKELERYDVKEQYAPILQHQVEFAYKANNKKAEETLVIYKARLEGATKKLDTLEEKYYVNSEMSRETFEKFYFKYRAKQAEISNAISKNTSGTSNLEGAVAYSIELSSRLAPLWVSQPDKGKSKASETDLSRKNHLRQRKWYILNRQNKFCFRAIASLSKYLEQKEKGQTGNETCLSLSADWTGLELSSESLYFQGLQKLQRDYSRIAH